MKIYVSGPMSGLTDKNRQAFMDAEELLVAAGYEVLTPARVDELFPPDPDEYRDWHWYMSKCLPMVDEADGLAMLPGWVKSRGARWEADRALEIGLPMASVETWCSRFRVLQREWATEA